MQTNVLNNPRINQTATIPTLRIISLKCDSLRYACTVELHLSRLTGTANYLEFRKSGQLFFNIGYNGSFKQKKFYKWLY
jgi:hypothetical protein